MKWALIFWIASCAGQDCPIESYEVMVYESSTKCVEVMKTWQNLGPEYRAVCIAGDREVNE